MLGVLQEEEVRTQTHTERCPCEGTGRKWPSMRKGGRPSEGTNSTYRKIVGFQLPDFGTQGFQVTAWQL